MPAHPAHRRAVTALTLATTAMLILTGCIGPTDPDHDTQVALEHIHGLAENPGTGGLLIASHGGIYQLDALTRDAELTGPIAGNDFDAMGFTAAGGALYASGHPGKNSPGHFGSGNLGLIRSDDGGDTWQNVSLAGEADFHDLTVSPRDPNRIYVNNFGIVHRSDDGGHSWNNGAGIDAWDILVDPADPDVIYATTSTGLHISRDGGRTFTLEPEAPRMVLIAAFSDGRLVGAGTDGQLVYQAPSGNWASGSELGTGLQALTTTKADGVIVAEDRGIRLFTSPDSPGQVLFRPDPHL
ncbi:hypothetical protein D8M34_13185 [Microbacterium sp. HSID17254]|nr:MULTISPECIES: hypothetical protein [Microbacterium]AMG83176.1 hypothetical protein AXH82_07180 [Microbacterium sp. PAMC 28756]OSP08636.1 hypothetical protein B7W94_03015 [Microbacterium sp. LEMMJ01]QXE30032.1 hypothetical protein IZR02_00445 [Microbacterium paraoxydans]RUQ04718.1 hypothetical protein D8M34_13185 [Microbacterium sp. HSID17254]